MKSIDCCVVETIFMTFYGSIRYKMEFVAFGKEHVEEAKKIGWENYQEERGFVPALPKDVKIWDLGLFCTKWTGCGGFGSRKTGWFFVLLFSLVKCL